MLLRLIISVAAGLTALPATAQDPPAAPAATAAAPVPGDAEIAAAAQAFRTQLEAMNAEVRAAVDSAGSNRRRAAGRVDEILTRYAPGIETFAVLLESYFGARAAAAPTDEARAAVTATALASVARVRGVPEQVRAGLAQQTRTAPDQPRNTQPSTGY